MTAPKRGSSRLEVRRPDRSRRADENTRVFFKSFAARAGVPDLPSVLRPSSSPLTCLSPSPRTRESGQGTRRSARCEGGQARRPEPADETERRRGDEVRRGESDAVWTRREGETVPTPARAQAREQRPDGVSK